MLTLPQNPQFSCLASAVSFQGAHGVTSPIDARGPVSVTFQKGLFAPENPRLCKTVDAAKDIRNNILVPIAHVTRIFCYCLAGFFR